MRFLRLLGGGALLLGAGVLGDSFPANAQQQQLLQETQELTLKIKTEDAMLLVQTLKAIQCPTVAQLALCQQSLDLLRSIQEQAKAQAK